MTGINKSTQRTGGVRFGMAATLLLRACRPSFAFVVRPRTIGATLPRTRTRPPWYHNSVGTSAGRGLSSIARDHHVDDDDDDDDDHDRRLFRVTAPYEPTGDQPRAIRELVSRLAHDEDRFSVLRGATGTGKTLVMSHVIAGCDRPALVLCHNKTLAAQLARELRSFLRGNAVELFVSHFNSYVPESYVATTGTYTAKRCDVNDEIDALRHRATRALCARRDVVVVASVSCLYGLGLPRDYLRAAVEFVVGEECVVSEEKDDDDDALSKLTKRLESMSYTRPETNDGEEADVMLRGNYRVARAATEDDAYVLTLWPPNETHPVRIELVTTTTAASSFVVRSVGTANEEGRLVQSDSVHVFPARHHFAASSERLERICVDIEEELRIRVAELESADPPRLVESDRLQRRVANDLLLLRETGFCPGGENYSRHFSGRLPGDPPDTLLDYFSQTSDNDDDNDWLLIVDESHVTLPQLRAMYHGDRARKLRLVEHGFRLPSALDHRPLREDEFWDRVDSCLLVSATPSATDEALAAPRSPVEMTLRPTHVPDPVVEVLPSAGQLAVLEREIRARAVRDERVLATTLTRRDAEDLAEWLRDRGVRATHVHSGLDTPRRADALRALQTGDVDCLVGVNLLREGLDLPQVSLVAVLRADAEGFLRSATSLSQTVGRAARNANGKAILFGNRVTKSMQRCVDETRRRRERQLAYNKKYSLTPRSTKGSSTMSIFDLLKEEIEHETSWDLSSSSSYDSGGAVEPPPPLSSSSSFVAESLSIASPHSDDGNAAVVVTDHVPSKPGVYFWRDASGRVLYVGKARRLRQRVRSYLAPNARHGPRIRRMLDRARSVDFVVTPSERDALVLESNSIRHHKPDYNVLLKEDDAPSYPYVCATVGDAWPTFRTVPRRARRQEENDTLSSSSRYRYFGPYPRYKDANDLLERIEEIYGLRAASFEARYDGDTSSKKEEYRRLFDRVLAEVFDGDGGVDERDRSDNNSNNNPVALQRREYEEASLLFDSPYNECRDVVALSTRETRKTSDGGARVVDALVHVVQLRKGLVAGRFSYPCELPVVASDDDDDENDENGGFVEEEDGASVIENVLLRHHYPSGAETVRNDDGDGVGFSFFPDEILTRWALPDPAELKRCVRTARTSNSADARERALSVRRVSSRAPRRETDERAVAFAEENARQILSDAARSEGRRRRRGGVVPDLVDGTASSDLAALLGLDRAPRVIECYDVSHTQGYDCTGSRVVFRDGRPAPELYRSFNVRTVEDGAVDDCRAVREVLRRRFHRTVVASDGDGDVDPAWALPDLVVVDGGVGQLGAAVQGMSSFSVSASFGNEIEDDDTVGSSVGEQRWTTVVPVCALAKNKEEVFLPGVKRPVNEVPDSPALLLLRALRDESHRFALKSHRKRRSRSTFRS